METHTHTLRERERERERERWREIFHWWDSDSWSTATHLSGVNSGSMRTVRKQHTRTMCCANGQSVAGKKDRILQFFTRSMARSTWMRTDAIRLVWTSSCESNCSQPSRKGGMFSETPGRISLIRKPLSAITLSPISNKLQMSDLFTSSACSRTGLTGFLTWLGNFLTRLNWNYQTQIQAGKQIHTSFFLHPLLSAESDLNPAANGA